MSKKKDRILFTQMRKLCIFFLLCCFSFSSYSQTVTNGNFNSNGTGWGCSPEAGNTENVYGGPSSTNKVAEIDAAAGLCQTVPGFTIGSYYRLTFRCSKRTNCGPATQSMNVSISAGALPATSVVRSGGWGYVNETHFFTATATSLTIDFVATIAGTCGLIVDNIAVTLVSALPIELLNFDCKLSPRNEVEINWSTASETNNETFFIERSQNGKDWSTLYNIKGAGNSNTKLDYHVIDSLPYSGISYYRLVQRDFDGKISKFDIKSVDVQTESNFVVFPNPIGEECFHISKGKNIKQTDIHLYDARGQVVTKNLEIINETETSFYCKLVNCNSGVYFLKVGEEMVKLIKK